MTIEELNSDRDKFLSKVKDNIDTELRKFGLYLMNINISDIPSGAYALSVRMTDKNGLEATAKSDTF